MEDMTDEVSGEEQAAAYMKLMDNVKQLIVDTVVEELLSYGRLQQAVDGMVRARLTDTSPSGTITTAVKEIIKNQMGKY